jgi:hypothetical protein
MHTGFWCGNLLGNDNLEDYKRRYKIGLIED